MELLEFVGIARLAHEPAGNLSYGQRKLLELASLLVADPAVLLLDEPAGGVNPTLITHLADRIKELNAAGKTILVVEHNMEFVMNLCSRVTVLSQGTAAGRRARPAEVRSNPAVLDAYLGGEDDEATQQQLADRLARRGSRSRRRRARDDGRPRAWTARTPLLSIRGVTAGYGGGDILKQVSLDVPEGGITCIVGPNGAGKSTLLATISGLLRPREGEIRFQRRVDLAGSRPARSSAAGSPRSRRPTACSREMTVRENVEMGAFTRRRQALCASACRPWRSSIRSSATAPTRRPEASPAVSSAWSSSPAA